MYIMAFVKYYLFTGHLHQEKIFIVFVLCFIIFYVLLLCVSLFSGYLHQYVFEYLPAIYIDTYFNIYCSFHADMYFNTCCIFTRYVLDRLYWLFTTLFSYIFSFTLIVVFTPSYVVDFTVSLTVFISAII